MHCDKNLLRNRSISSWILVVFVLALISWAFLTFLFAYLFTDSLLFHPSPFIQIYSIILLIITCFLVFNVYYCYIICVFYHPGGPVPSEWNLTDLEIQKLKQEDTSMFAITSPDLSSTSPSPINQNQKVYDFHPRSFEKESMQIELEENNVSESNIEKKRNGSIRYCSLCKVRKPDRCHHCSTCGTCVLKMDHHCVWMNNCLGFHNYKFFVLFLFYLCISCCLYCFVTTISLFQMISKNLSTATQRQQNTGDNNPLPTFGQFNLIWNYLICFFFGISLSLFLGYHIYLICYNSTTIEAMEKRSKFERLYSSSHPYNIGVMNNLKSVLGDNPLLWLLPTLRSVQGTGCEFPIADTTFLKETSRIFAEENTHLNIEEEEEETNHLVDEEWSNFIASRHL